MDSSKKVADSVREKLQSELLAGATSPTPIDSSNTITIEEGVGMIHPRVYIGY